MPFKSYKEESKADWGRTIDEPKADLSNDELKLGAILRIADATEAMAKSHVKLQQDYDYMKNHRDYYYERCQQLENSIRSYRGTITKLKKQLNQSN